MKKRTPGKYPTMSAAEFRDAYQRLGYSQTKMAEELGVSRRSIDLWNKGERQFSGPAVLLLKRILIDHEPVKRKRAKKAQ